LSMLKEKSQYDFLQLSEVFSNYYISQKFVPPEKILTAMQITPDLTKFIQIYGFDQNATNVIYYKELDTLGSNVFNAADKEVEKKKINLLTHQLVNYFQLNSENLPLSQSEARI